MPRTTIDLDSSLLEELKKRQAAEGKTLSRLVSELLARALFEPEAGPRELSWTSQDMGARFDLEDKDRLYQALDET
ncbi:MAG TPA: antitoxin [Actinobacteria bacterium]|nr:antitoxin [Actinomycetota bacterium]HDK45293.1 antitoxin [Actinomycetota bacterium]HDK45900.1 antitoxin [Actinomycetota bacterium]HDL48419.1 antitoxin [Actinomycetota bacterium]